MASGAMASGAMASGAMARARSRAMAIAFSATTHPGGITTVDAEYWRPGFASVHLLERGGRVAVVDTGTNDSVAHVLAALDGLGFERSAVDLVFVTHVHLDHAGGAGLMMRELPSARAVAHPRSVPHLVDPSRLAEASRAVYGAELFERLYGTPLPIERERIIETRDGDTLSLGSVPLAVLHTPGHALHHHVLHDPVAGAVFTGDTFGLSYRALDTERGACILPTTSPSQFDPEQLVASIRRIVALGPESLYLTHYGRVSGASRLGASLEAQIERFVSIARDNAAAPDRKARIVAGLRSFWIGVLEQHGAPPAAVDDLLAGDLELNAQGLVAWLERGERGR
jgi:glyoxylase-like metal-dependent hydrolase (beta-lactamase superfamily II)